MRRSVAALCVACALCAAATAASPPLRAVRAQREPEPRPSSAAETALLKSAKAFEYYGDMYEMLRDEMDSGPLETRAFAKSLLRFFSHEGLSRIAESDVGVDWYLEPFSAGAPINTATA